MLLNAAADSEVGDYRHDFMPFLNFRLINDQMLNLFPFFENNDVF